MFSRSLASFQFRVWLPSLFTLSAMVLPAVPVFADGHIAAKLSFSTDNGVTYRDLPPSVPGAQEVLVKVDFAVEGEDRPIEGNIVTTSLRSEEADFASANVGRQSWAGKPGWYQRIETSWFDARRPGTALYKLDLRARPQGVLGHGNRWNPGRGVFEDGPLPAIAARGAGTFNFTFRINYRAVGVANPVVEDLPFQVIIGSQAPVAPDPVPGRPILPPDSPTLPALSGDKLWDASEWSVVAGTGKLASTPPFVKTRLGQEAGLRLADVKPGDYYVRIQVESGSANGEDELSKDLPFLYLNGRPIDFARATPIAPFDTTNVTVIESRNRVHIEPGDQLRWNATRRSGRLFGGVALSAQPLDVAPVELKPFYDPALQDVFRVAGGFKMPEANAGKMAFNCDVRNLSGKAGDFQVHIEVRDFWQRVVAQKDEQITVPDQTMQTELLQFAPGDSDRYRAIVRITGPGGVTSEKVFEQLVNNSQGSRPRLWLNEGWEWSSIPDNGSLATRTLNGDATAADRLTGWQKANAPFSWQDTKPKDHIAYHRIRFTVPEGMAGKRLFVHFSRVVYESRVYLNGTLLGEHFGQTGAFEFEATKAVRPGENELLVQVRDGIAALEEDVLKTANVDITSRSRVRAPQPWRGGIGETWLYGAGQQPIRDVFVQTSFREKNIRLEIEPPVLPAGTRAIITNRVLSAGQEVLRLPDATVPQAGTGPIVVTQPWANPILWNPGDPKLLQLVTELKSPDGTVLDRLDTRFGFREFWPEGRSLMWNGTPMKFAAVPFLSTWGVAMADRSKRDNIREMLLMCKRLGVNMQRHIYDPEYRAEMNDEEGIVMAESFGGIAYPSKQMVDSDEFWKNTAVSDGEAIKNLRNHPAIVTWYISNEFWGATEPDNQRRLQELGRALAPLDPTRIQEFGCDLDLGGYASIISTHYPVDVRALREESGVFPEAAYWRRFDAPLQPGTKAPAGLIRYVANVRGEAPITWGNKPLVVNETLWNFFFNTPDGLSRLVGDEVYTGPNAAERAYKEANTWFIRGHRDADASVVTPWEFVGRNPIGLEMPAIDINPLQRYSHFYGGQTVHFDVNLHHDRPVTSKLEFVWTLRKDGTEVKRVAQPMTFTSGELKRVPLDLALPEVKQRSAYSVTLQLTENGAELRRVVLPLDVQPRVPVTLPITVRCGLYDPQGTAQKTIASFAGQQPVPVAALSAEGLRGIQLLIIAPDAALTDSAEIRAALDAFLTNGGRVLVLAQSKAPASLPARLITTGLVANQMWSFRSSHPVLQGMSPADLVGWYPTERSGTNFYVKPEDGNWKTLAESGGPAGLVYSGLLETTYGRGLMVCSQLNLTSNLDTNPVAVQLWNNLLAYMSKATPAPARTGIWSEAKSSFSTALQNLGVAATPVKTAADLKGLDVLLLDANLKLDAESATAIGQFVRGGGKLLLHGTTPDNKALASQLCGGTVRVLEPAPRAWSGRAVRIAASDFSAGINNYDLFWKRRPDTEDYAAAYTNDAGTLAPLGDWSLKVPSGRMLLYPGYLAEVPLGTGTVLLDNLNWDKGSPLTRANSRRLASAMLTNLGVRLETPKPLVVPANLAYRPVDLSGVMNRTFVDEVAEDGKGGWTDQGPTQDMRTFPTDQPVQNFLGVPIRIEKEKGALVLASQFRKAGPPQRVELPVAGRADALFFLQTSAWTSKAQHGSYIVNYTDGTAYEIRLIGDVNLRDWMASNASDSFPQETDTITRLAWSGGTPGQTPAHLFLMTWPNPHPEKEIRSVTFSSENRGVPVLVGVTVGTRQTGAANPVPGTVTAPVQNEAGARDLVQQGRELRRNGNLEEAAARFEAARKADPASDAAYLELASIREVQKRWPDAIRTYQDLLAVTPDHLEALYRLGKAYQEAGRWDDAEKTFRHSLDVNRNQPDILQAIAELQQKRPKA